MSLTQIIKTKTKKEKPNRSMSQVVDKFIGLVKHFFSY